MGIRFDPVRFLGHILLASFGSGLGMILTFVVAWQAGGGAGSFESRTVVATMLIGFMVMLPLIFPGAVALLIAALFMRARLPGIEPGGGGMILILGLLGVLIEVALALMFNVDEKGEVGRFALLSVAVGGALCGIIIGWRMKRG